MPCRHVIPIRLRFHPGTCAEDSDALDILVLTESPLFAGRLVHVHLVGMICATQKAGRTSIRNERLIGVLETPVNKSAIHDIRDLSCACGSCRSGRRGASRPTRTFAWKSRTGSPFGLKHPPVRTNHGTALQQEGIAQGQEGMHERKRGALRSGRSGKKIMSRKRHPVVRGTKKWCEILRRGSQETVFEEEVAPPGPGRDMASQAAAPRSPGSILSRHAWCDHALTTQRYASPALFSAAPPRRHFATLNRSLATQSAAVARGWRSCMAASHARPPIHSRVIRVQLVAVCWRVEAPRLAASLPVVLQIRAHVALNVIAGERPICAFA